MLTPILIETTVSIQYVSSTPVVIAAVLNNQLRHIQIHKMMRHEKNRRQQSLFQSEHKHDNPVLCLDCVCAKISVIYVTTRSVKPPISSLFYNKTPKTQQVVKKANEFFSSHDGTFTPAKKNLLI